MDNRTKMFFFIILYTIHFFQTWGAEALTTENSSNVLAQLINIRSRDDNKWMVAVKKGKSWVVKIKQTIPKDETISDIFIHMYTRDSPSSFQESFFVSDLCSLLTDFSYSRFFPKDIINMILPGYQGSCEIKKGEVQVQTTRCVSSDIQQNPLIPFPASNAYELIVDFLSKTLPDNRRFFRVNLKIGNKTGCLYGEGEKDNGTLEDKCQDTWEIAKPICIVYQTVTSTISEFATSIKNIF